MVGNVLRIKVTPTVHLLEQVIQTEVGITLILEEEHPQFLITTQVEQSLPTAVKIVNPQEEEVAILVPLTLKEMIFKTLTAANSLPHTMVVDCNNTTPPTIIHQLTKIIIKTIDMVTNRLGENTVTRMLANSKCFLRQFSFLRVNSSRT